MKSLYPLQFQPVFRQYLWGGRKLGSVLKKPISGEGVFAESWEIADHGDAQVIVRDGPLAGKSLRHVIEQHSKELFGNSHDTWLNAKLPPQLAGRFPLLFKFLDCNQNLSVQVHPNDEQGSRLAKPDLGKTEAWYVVAKEPGAKLYAGLKAGVGRVELEKAVASGRTEEVLHVVEPEVGDCVFIPAGTIHALGEGLLIAEIQQASDTTYRLYDWNRVGPDGKPRPLHIKESLDVSDYNRGPVEPVQPKKISDSLEELVACDKFRLCRRKVNGEVSLDATSFRIIAVLQGTISIQGMEQAKKLGLGETVLLPANSNGYSIQGADAVLMDITLP